MSGNLLNHLYGSHASESPALLLESGRSLSTTELHHNVARYAAALLALGVKPGDRVSFKLEKCPETLFLAHACLMTGTIMHPLNPTYTRVETESLIHDAQPVVYVCSPEAAADDTGLAPRLETLAAECKGSLAELAIRSAPLQSPVTVDPDDTAALLYTSGTTSRQKGARITHRNLAESARALAQVWEVGPSDTLLHALPIYHAHGLLTAINTALCAGAAIRFLPRFEPKEVLAAMRSATFIMGVPTFYTRLLKEPELEAAVHPRFRLAISGSAPLNVETAAQFTRRTGVPIVERYGATETAIVTAVPPSEHTRSGWVGWPLPGIEIRVEREAGELAKVDATGMLQTRGHNVFAGYWNRPDADAEAFTSDGWFITGDLAHVDHTGCVRLLGRAKDLVITGGLNVYPAEVERALDAIDGIAESAVFGAPHPDLGEAVAAVVELESGGRFDEAQAIAALRSRLAPYKIPKRILAVEGIPRNRLGKVLKSELRSAYADLFTHTLDKIA
jgi:malonyl-CoA/methylmalonyl-CoA synthetase